MHNNSHTETNKGSPLRRIEELLNLPPLQMPQPIDVAVRLPTRDKSANQAVTPAASPEDQIARQAAAEIEREEGFPGCADHRLRGAYDGDTEHRIALKAIELFKQLNGGAGLPNKQPASIK
jgi:hypothetical protein